MVAHAASWPWEPANGYAQRPPPFLSQSGGAIQLTPDNCSLFDAFNQESLLIV
jgi:hypothetical protein